MTHGDFYGSEVSITINKATKADIIHTNANGKQTILREGIALQAGEIIDSSRLSMKALKSFFTKQIKEAKEQGVLFSLHMKATMMKVSDPIIFGACVEVFFSKVFEKFADEFAQIDIDVKNGLGDVFTKIQHLNYETRKQIEAALQEAIKDGPDLAMVNS